MQWVLTWSPKNFKNNLSSVMSIIKLEIVHRSNKEHLKSSSPESNAASQTAGLDISGDIDDHSIISEGHKDLSTKYVPMKQAGGKRGTRLYTLTL